MIGLLNFITWWFSVFLYNIVFEIINTSANLFYNILIIIKSRLCYDYKSIYVYLDYVIKFKQRNKSILKLKTQKIDSKIINLKELDQQPMKDKVSTPKLQNDSISIVYVMTLQEKLFAFLTKKNLTLTDRLKQKNCFS